MDFIKSEQFIHKQTLPAFNKNHIPPRFQDVWSCGTWSFSTEGQRRKTMSSFFSAESRVPSSSTTTYFITWREWRKDFYLFTVSKQCKRFTGRGRRNAEIFALNLVGFCSSPGRPEISLTVQLERNAVSLRQPTCENTCRNALMQGGGSSWCHSLAARLKQPGSNCQLHECNWIGWAGLNNHL